MKKESRRMISAFAVFCVLILSLSACSSSKKEEPAEEKQTTAAAAAQEEAAAEEAATEAAQEETVTETAAEEAVTEAAQEEAVTEAAVEEPVTEAAAEEAVTEAAQEEAVTEAAAEEAVTEAAQESVTETGAEISVGSDLPQAFSIAGWDITVEDAQVNKSLENISVSLGYSGVETSEYAKTAGEGNTFCMVKLLTEKKGSREVIDWSKMLLVSEDGQEYQRIEDEFILDLGMKRMPGTNLNFGSNEGWIAYEIPEGSTGLTLTYAFEEEELSVSLM